MVQANLVRDALLAAHDWSGDRVEIVPLTASGDRILDRALAEVGGKALWTKELDWALGEGEIDFAVHSMKDVETVRPADITIAAMLPRADVRDRLIGAESLAALKPGAVIGTSAPRRTAQILRARPDAQVILFRGNVATRLAKLDAGEADATLLAAAGLERLAMPDIGAPLSIDAMLPAPSQGAVGIETLTANDAVRGWLAAINHDDTLACVLAERAFLAGLNAGCHSPVAAHAVLEDGAIWLRVEIMAADGTETHAGEARFAVGDLETAVALGRDLLSRASPDVQRLFG
jgi:hydroxymethylbilane synthase